MGRTCLLSGAVPVVLEERSPPMRRRLFLLVVALGLLTLWPGTAWVTADDGNHATTDDGNHATYQFYAGVSVPGGIAVEGPDKATAHNGSTVTLTGSGIFDAGPGKTASGGGTYTITVAAGTTVA